MTKHRLYHIFLNIALPGGLIILQAIFQFLQLVILEIDIFGLQEPDYTPENEALFYKEWIPFLIMGCIFILVCGLLIAIGFIKNKNNRKNTTITLFITTAVAIISLFAILIMEIVHLNAIGLYIFRSDMLWNWGFYYLFSPYILMVLTAILLAVLRIIDQVGDMKMAFRKREQNTAE